MEGASVGIITCDRPDFLIKCVDSIRNSLEDINLIGVVNDGKAGFNIDSLARKVDFYHHNPTNLGVCKSKNIALKKLLESGSRHIFLVEDDIIVKNPSVFRKYIEHAQQTGLQHLMHGYHGPANKKDRQSHGVPDPKLIVNYGKDISIALNEHCVGAFCYYSRLALETVGLLDENFVNAFDHVEHSYRIAKAGMNPGYWWWPDVANSHLLLDELACSEESSTIRNRDDWRENIQKAALYFKEKHGYLPAWNGCVPMQTEDEIKQNLKAIYTKYGRH